MKCSRSGELDRYAAWAKELRRSFGRLNDTGVFLLHSGPLSCCRFLLEALVFFHRARFTRASAFNSVATHALLSRGCGPPSRPAVSHKPRTD